MRNFRGTLTVLLFALLTGCSSTPSSSTPDGLTPSGSFTVRENQLLRVAAGGSGQGTLIFQGWEYPFLFENAKVDVAGDNPVDVTGTVYNLERVEDFEGVYTLTEAETGRGAVISGIWAKNDKGVITHLDTQGQDVKINVEATGVKFTLKQ